MKELLRVISKKRDESAFARFGVTNIVEFSQTTRLPLQLLISCIVSGS
jgi:hypothetical protein